MPASAPVALGLGGVAALFLISGIQGKSLTSILQGDFGNPHDPAFKGGEGVSETTKGTTEAPTGPIPAGLISPFPKSTVIKWGRSDQGIDGVATTGAAMVAMGDGEVTVAHDPNGFGPNYPVLHVTGDGSYYYGHSVPAVASGTKVKKGQVIAHTNTHGQGNATTPGAFEIGKWPPGSMSAGAAIREWFMHLPRIQV